MPKQLITAIGLVVSLGIVTLAVVLIAVPLWAQSLSVDAQTATVASTNQIYEAQVQALQADSERQDEIDASVAALRTQIPAAAELDDVFEVIARAAAASGVIISSATAGEPTAFTVRTTSTEIGAEPAVAAPVDDASAGSEDAGAGDAATAEGDDVAVDPNAPTTAAPDEGAPLTGRQQIDFTILVTANDMAQATAFLDELRTGPRLLSAITAVTNQTGTAVDVQVSALTFVDSEE
ncbi:hypothetical protein [Microbacterium sp.]|uniref:hypothetical protein n=1 Tax=Microbacterium sp. TaxID=51671 RepID=UPI0035B18B87